MIIGGQNIMCSESNNVFLSTTKSSGTDFSIAAIMAKQNHLKSESSTDDKNSGSNIDEITSDSEDNNVECGSSKSIREVSKSPSIDGDDRSTPDSVKVGFLFV